MILRGKEVANQIEENIKEKLPKLYEKGIVPTLAILRVGDNSSDIAYENSAVKKAKNLGIQVEKYTAPKDIEEEDLLNIVYSINQNDKIHGVLMLRPLPKHIDENKVRNALTPSKDLDGISDGALAGVFTKTPIGFPPCTAEACIKILNFYELPISGKKAVVIGRSMVIGRPVAMMLMHENATVTICHTKTTKEDLIKYCKDADIIITAAGKANAFTSEMTDLNQVIIDVGINFNEAGKMVGDADFEAIEDKVKDITPVPGGVGSVTTSLLMLHLVEAAEKMVV